MENEIKETLEIFSNSFLKEADIKHAEWIKNIKNEYSYLDIQKPEYFSLLISITLDQQQDTLIRSVLSNIKIDNKKKHKVEFTYVQYNFISKHLNVIIESKGYICSTDETRWLINTYFQYLITDDIPIINEKKLGIPPYGEISDWMLLIDSMYELYYGEIEQYVLMKNKINK